MSDDDTTMAPAMHSDDASVAGARHGAHNSRSGARRTAVGIVSMVLGIALLFYPIATSFMNERRANNVVMSYVQNASTLSADSKASMLAAAQAYNDEIFHRQGGILPIGSSESDSDAEYQSLLDTGGAMATVSIPKIAVDLPVFHGTTESVLAAGAGHLYGSSLPVGGPNTHSVIAAHRGMPTALMFTRLDELEVGDVFTITVLGETHAYQVDLVSVIEPDDTSLFTIDPGKDYVSLLTCTPYGINSQRLVVRGKRLADVPPAQKPELGVYPADYTFAVIGVAAVSTMAVIWKMRRSSARPHGLHIAD